MNDNELSDHDILGHVVTGWWPWKRAAAALRAKGWDQVSLFNAHDEAARLYQERKVAGLLREYESHVTTEFRAGRWPGDREMPRFRDEPQSKQIIGIRNIFRRSR